MEGASTAINSDREGRKGQNLAHPHCRRLGDTCHLSFTPRRSHPHPDQSDSRPELRGQSAAGENQALDWLVGTQQAPIRKEQGQSSSQSAPASGPSRGGCARAGGLELWPGVEPRFLTATPACAALQVGEVDVGGDRTGECRGFSSWLSLILGPAQRLLGLGWGVLEVSSRMRSGFRSWAQVGQKARRRARGLLSVSPRPASAEVGKPGACGSLVCAWREVLWGPWTQLGLGSVFMKAHGETVGAISPGCEHGCFPDIRLKRCSRVFSIGSRLDNIYDQGVWPVVLWRFWGGSL